MGLTFQDLKGPILKLETIDGTNSMYREDKNSDFNLECTTLSLFMYHVSSFNTSISLKSSEWGGRCGWVMLSLLLRVNDFHCFISVYELGEPQLSEEAR